MKKNNQFNLPIQITYDDDTPINHDEVEIIVFTLGNITKKYQEENSEVVYDEVLDTYNIYLTQQETANLNETIPFEVRVKFKNNDIFGSVVGQRYVYSSINKEEL